MNNDIPLEAVLKYIKKDRDRYREISEALQKENEKLKKRVEKYEEMISGLQKEIMSSEPFKTLLKKNQQLRRENKELINNFYSRKSSVKE